MKAVAKGAFAMKVAKAKAAVVAVPCDDEPKSILKKPAASADEAHMWPDAEETVKSKCPPSLVRWIKGHEVRVFNVLRVPIHVCTSVFLF